MYFRDWKIANPQCEEIGLTLTATSFCLDPEHAPFVLEHSVSNSTTRVLSLEELLMQ